MADKSELPLERTSPPHGKPIRPTLKTIAELSGFAVQTVSRALGDAPDISAKTKAKIRQIANDIGYVPNRAGVRLRTGKTNVISLILGTDNDVLSLTSRLISTISNALRETPYHLVMTPAFPDEDPLRAVRYIVENQTADAIIMNRIRPEDPRVKYLMDKGFPFATHGRTIWSANHPYFDYDNEAFGDLAIETLARRGRKKILMLAPPFAENYALDMLRGAQAAGRRHDLPISVCEGITSDSHRNAIRSYFKQYMLNHPEIDALVIASPNATMAAIAGMEDAGRKLGPDIDVVSKETVPLLDLFRPGILSIREDVTKAGLFLAKAAVAAVKNPDDPPM